MKKTILVICLVFLAWLLLTISERDDPMAVDFTNVNEQQVAFTHEASWKSTQKSILIWIDFDSLLSTYHEAGAMYEPVGADWTWFVIITPYVGAGYDPGKFSFAHGWSSASGGYAAWHSTNDVLTTGVHLIAITYNGSSTGNNPVFYVDGASVAVTETVAPAGTIAAGTDANLYVGASASSEASPDGKILSFLLYDRVLSAGEVSSAYNSRLAVPFYDGLVFAPNLVRADGVTAPHTLTGTDYLYDLISGAQGTPNGSPVLRSDDYLRFK